MRRRVFRIRRWLALAVAVSALVIASGAQAQVFGGDDEGRASGGNGGVVTTRTAPVGGTTAGFDWGYAVASAGVGLVLAVAGVGIVQLGRNRRRLATLL